MRFAETGFNLEIDLATGNIERVVSNPEDTELFLGGLGTAVKLIWDRVPPEVEAFDPENLLIFSAGLLCGTPAFSANRTIVSTISPQHNLLAYPMMGGFWAAELKYAGYDKIIFRNKSPQLVYIWIHDDKVEIRDAAHLKGKGALEVQDLIREEVGELDAQVAAIGLAGENRVFTASIEQGRSSASRLGGGAVMGDKNIKAVAVRGTKDVYLARGAEFIQQVNEVADYIRYRNENPIPNVMTIMGGIGSPQEMLHTDEKWHTEGFAWGNARQRRKGFWTPEIEESWTKTQLSAVKRLISCFNCPQQCGALIAYKDVPRYMMKCFSKLTYAMAAYVDDLDFSFRIVQQATEYGVDGFSTPQIMAFAVELHEAGILTDADFAGLPDRQGGAFLLAARPHRPAGRGSATRSPTALYWAARRIGNGAEKFATTPSRNTNSSPQAGHAQPPLLPHVLHRRENQHHPDRGEVSPGAFPTREEREAVRQGLDPGSGRQVQALPARVGAARREIESAITPRSKPAATSWTGRKRCTTSTTPSGPAPGMSSFPLKPPYHIHNFPKFISAGTGIDFDSASLWKAATRNRTLLRAINVRRGMRRADDKPPEDHWKRRFPDLEKTLLDAYYELKGWNSNGIPTKATLLDLDLDYVAEDLERRGILDADGAGAGQAVPGEGGSGGGGGGNGARGTIREGQREGGEGS